MLEGDVSDIITLNQPTSFFSLPKATRMSPYFPQSTVFVISINTYVTIRSLTSGRVQYTIRLLYIKIDMWKRTRLDIG